jgi:hypothetical protein
MPVRAIAVPPKGTSKTYPSDRVCEATGCTTRLSVYNASSFCWQHEVAHPFVFRVDHRVERSSGSAA